MLSAHLSAPLTRIKDEIRRQQFQRAIHDGLDIERAVIILVQLRTGHTRDQINTRLWRSAGLARTSNT
jgi:hypothetical protein